jgi:hypothetical protein
MLDIIISFSTPEGFNFFWYPVTPPKINFGGNMMVEQHDVISRGQIVIPKGNEPRTITWSGLFPELYEPTMCQYGSRDPATGRTLESSYLPHPRLEAVPRMYYLMRNAIPVTMFMGDWIVDWPMYLTSFTPYEQGGEVGDVYYDLTFTEAIPVVLRTTDVSVVDAPYPTPTPFDQFIAWPGVPAPKPPFSNRTDDRQPIESYVTRPISVNDDGEPVGEQLWEIAVLTTPEGQETFTIEQLITANIFEGSESYPYLANDLPIPAGTRLWLPPGAKIPRNLDPASQRRLR